MNWCTGISSMAVTPSRVRWSMMTGDARPGQLDGGHAQPGQVVDDDRGRQARIGAALLGRDLGMAQGQAADMRLVDHRLVVRSARLPVVPPVEIRISNDIARHKRGTVAGADRIRRAGPVREQGLVPAHLALDGLAVRVEQQLYAG